MERRLEAGQLLRRSTWEGDRHVACGPHTLLPPLVPTIHPPKPPRHLSAEPSSPNCSPSGGKANCPTDAEGIAAVTALRTALPKGSYLLSTASFHVGCYGEGAFAASKPSSKYTGINLAMARSTAGQQLDLINIMAYDAGNLASTGFDPKESLRAHRSVWPNAAVALGVEVRGRLLAHRRTCLCTIQPSPLSPVAPCSGPHNLSAKAPTHPCPRPPKPLLNPRCPRRRGVATW